MYAKSIGSLANSRAIISIGHVPNCLLHVRRALLPFVFMLGNDVVEAVEVLNHDSKKYLNHVSKMLKATEK